MGLGHVSIQDCNNEMEMMIRSTKGAVGWTQRYFKLDTPTDKLVVDLLYNKSLDCLLLFYDDGKYITLYKDFLPSEDSGYLLKRDGSKWKEGNYTIILFKAVPLDDMKIDGRLIADGTLPYTKINNKFINEMIKDLENNYTINGKVITNKTLPYAKIDKDYITQMIQDLENNYNINGKVITDKTLSYNKIDKDYIVQMIKDLENNYTINGKVITNGTITYDKIDKNYITRMIQDLENNYTINGKVIKQGTISLTQVSQDFLNNINTKIKDASLTEKGVVKLCNDVNSTNESMAATPKAIKTTYDLAKKGSFFGIANGGGNQYNCVIEGLNYFDGLEFKVVFTSQPGNDARLNINGQGNFNLKLGPDNISDGDIEANIPYTFIKYGNNFFCKASSRGKDSDDPTIPSGDGNLYASIPLLSNYISFVRIKNKNEVYTIYNNNLYLLNCKKKKFKQINTKGEFGFTHPNYYSNGLRKWKNMYVYGNKVYSSSFNLLKDFTFNRTKEYKVQHYKGKDNRKSTEYITLSDYIILDTINDRLFLIKNYHTNEFYNPFTSIREYKNDTSTYEYDYYVKLYMEIYEVDSSFNIKLIKTIYNDDLAYGLYAGDDNCDLPSVAVINYPYFYIYSGDYSYKNGDSFSFSYPYVCDNNNIFEKKSLDRIGIINQEVPPRSGSNHNTYYGLVKYNINDLSDRKYIMVGKNGNHREDLSSVPDNNIDETFKIRKIHDGYGDDCLITMEYRYDRESDRSSNERVARGYYTYDIKHDKMIGYTQDDSKGSKKHSASERIYLNEKIENMIYTSNITNNPNQWISSHCIHGMDTETGDYYINFTDKYDYSCITSCFGIKTRNKLLSYNNGNSLEFKEIIDKRWYSRKDRWEYYMNNYSINVLSLLFNSIPKSEIKKVIYKGGWYNKKYTERYYKNIKFTTEEYNDSQISDYELLNKDYTGSSITIKGIGSFTLKKEYEGIQSLDPNRYNYHDTVLDIYKF